MVPVYDLFNHRNIMLGPASGISLSESESGPTLGGYNTIVEPNEAEFTMKVRAWGEAYRRGEGLG